MKTGLIATMVAAGLAVGFGCGWLVAHVQNIDKVAPARIWTDNWIRDVSLLTGGGLRTTLIPPDKTQSFIESGLNADSLVLGRVYDSLSQARKQEIMFYIPSARAIATAQHKSGPPLNMSGVTTFVGCVQKVRLQGGLVRNCIKNEH